ncbi:unnamed protein product [Darwinula stevensoni]|uniref:Uncharacterized protein n=1 Tax=Darwinula stevensoni TaxID=69355 RepID=A0A7R8XE53_9CRUS|nr:unnamed protein product [Darwinula stevensoni]CAG0895426.1 unnamed protein product [Darwinula stevensoni]
MFTKAKALLAPYALHGSPIEGASSLLSLLIRDVGQQHAWKRSGNLVETDAKQLGRASPDVFNSAAASMKKRIIQDDEFHELHEETKEKRKKQALFLLKMKKITEAAPQRFHRLWVNVHQRQQILKRWCTWELTSKYP